MGTEVKKSTWDRKSVPVKRPELLNLPKDARNWEVEDDRLEVSGVADVQKKKHNSTNIRF